MQQTFLRIPSPSTWMITSGKVAEAFRLEREPDRVRERYGRNQFGQSLLLARRLVQAMPD